MKNLILSLITIATLSSASQETESHTFSEFNAIKASGYVKVTMVPGDEYKAVITASSKEDLEQVEVDVENNELKINARLDSDNGEEKPSVKVTYKKDAHFITIQSTGNSEIEGHEHQISGKLLELTVRTGGHIHLDVAFDELEASVTAGGSINLKGSAERFDASVTSGGTVGAYRVDAKNVKARVKAGGDIMCQPLEELDAKATTGGTIYYLGEPTGKIKKKSALGGDVIYRESTDIVR